jgi:hypothetical protein
VDPIAMTMSQIFFSLWISTSFGINAGICAMYRYRVNSTYKVRAHKLNIFNSFIT